MSESERKPLPLTRSEALELSYLQYVMFSKTIDPVTGEVVLAPMTLQQRERFQALLTRHRETAVGFMKFLSPMVDVEKT